MPAPIAKVFITRVEAIAPAMGDLFCAPCRLLITDAVLFLRDVGAEWVHERADSSGRSAGLREP